MVWKGEARTINSCCFHPLHTQTWSDSRLLGPIHGCLSHDYTLSVEWHTTGQTAVLSSYDILAYWPLTFLLYTTLRWTYLFYNFVTRVCAFICMCDVYCVSIYGHHCTCILGYRTYVALFITLKSKSTAPQVAHTKWLVTPEPVVLAGYLPCKLYQECMNCHGES